MPEITLTVESAEELECVLAVIELFRENRICNWDGSYEEFCADEEINTLSAVYDRWWEVLQRLGEGAAT
jgi:hypothetical protein